VKNLLRTGAVALLLLVNVVAFAGETKLYLTKTGHKYHRANCQYLRKSKIEVTLSEAKKRGMTPCSKCKPPVEEVKTGKGHGQRAA